MRLSREAVRSLRNLDTHFATLTNPGRRRYARSYAPLRRVPEGVEAPPRAGALRVRQAHRRLTHCSRSSVPAPPQANAATSAPRTAGRVRDPVARRVPSAQVPRRGRAGSPRAPRSRRRRGCRARSLDGMQLLRVRARPGCSSRPGAGRQEIRSRGVICLSSVTSAHDGDAKTGSAVDSRSGEVTCSPSKSCNRRRYRIRRPCSAVRPMSHQPRE
jgi:hypothetical protein